MVLLSTFRLGSSGTDVGGALVGIDNRDWLETEFPELRVFNVGRPILERLLDDGDGLTANPEVVLGTGLGSSDSTK